MTTDCASWGLLLRAVNSSRRWKDRYAYLLRELRWQEEPFIRSLVEQLDHYYKRDACTECEALNSLWLERIKEAKSDHPVYRWSREFRAFVRSLHWPEVWAAIRNSKAKK